MPAHDVAIVGAGIVGLAQAWAAARQGKRVLVIERSPRAEGASIRNFGMVWPIGQPTGQPGDSGHNSMGRHDKGRHDTPNLYQTALRSRRLWEQIARDAKLWRSEPGSLHLAYHDDEWAVLQEFVALDLGYQVRLVTPGEIAGLAPAVRRTGLRGGLWSETEFCVDPRQAIGQIPAFLQDRHDVTFRFASTAVEASSGEVRTADGQVHPADEIVICSGADFQTLFPDVYADAGISTCKLQMMRTGPQAHGWRIGPMIAGGLTLRHYPTFAACPSLAAVKHRIASTTPILDQYGIHVMASQNHLGEVIIGDSHEYNDAISPFDKIVIDQLILRELQNLIDLPDWTIAERWHGIYAKLPGQAQFVAEPLPGVRIVNATGGSGMTMSFGLADEAWSDRREAVTL